jgi:hypothetical protein
MVMEPSFFLPFWNIFSSSPLCLFLCLFFEMQIPCLLRFLIGQFFFSLSLLFWGMLAFVVIFVLVLTSKYHWVSHLPGGGSEDFKLFNNYSPPQSSSSLSCSSYTIIHLTPHQHAQFYYYHAPPKPNNVSSFIEELLAPHPWGGGGGGGGANILPINILTTPS